MLDDTCCWRRNSSGASYSGAIVCAVEGGREARSLPHLPPHHDWGSQSGGGWEITEGF